MKATKKIGMSTRERLLKEALCEFSEHGFAGATVDRIVAAAQVNKRMVYHYFGSKEDLYCAVLGEVFDRLAQVDAVLFSVKREPEAAIRETVHLYFRFLRDNADLVQLLLWENLQKGKYIESISDRVIKNPMLDYLGKIIEEGIAAGKFRRNLRIQHLLITLIGICLIYFSNRYTLTRTIGLDLGEASVLKEAANQAAELMIRGISAGK